MAEELVLLVGRGSDSVLAVRRSRLRISDLGHRTFFLLACLAVATIAVAADPPKPTLESLGNKVQCTCGCVAPLNQCPHFDCAQKAEIQAFIKKEIAEGKDEPAILQNLAARYGLRVLSAPPARGFNLAAWILPGVGLLLGLAIVVVIARRWRRPEAVAPAPVAVHDPKVLAAIEEEMKSVDGIR